MRFTRFTTTTLAVSVSKSFTGSLSFIFFLIITVNLINLRFFKKKCLCYKYLFGYVLLIDVLSYLDLNKGRSSCGDRECPI